MEKQKLMGQRRFSYGKPAKVDKIDWEILQLLAADARMPVSRIARKLGFTREVVKYRIERLKREKVILSFLTWTNPPKLGYTVWGYMHIAFKDLTPEKEKAFLDHVKAHPHISFAYSALGRFDVGIEFLARDLGHFYDLQKEFKDKFATIIKDYETGSFIDVYKVNYVPMANEGAETALKEK